MKDAINKAIEGGFHNVKIFNRYLPASNIKKQIKESGFIHAILLDPLFWQALGKAEGWKKCTMYSFSTGKVYSEHEWQFNMHRFIDHIIAGGTVDDFFNNLLK